MKLTTADVLVKPEHYGQRAAALSLARWKWKVLEAVDGVRTIGAIARMTEVDAAAVLAFADDCVDDALLVVETLTLEAYGAQRVAAAPAAPPSAAPSSAAAVPPAASAPAAKVASLQERVAALKARALSALSETPERPEAEPVEFSLAASPATDGQASRDAVEFSL